jgi:hypothetical protein
MAFYTLKVRRYQPESGEGPYWEEFGVDLDPSLSVLDGILQAKDRDDGSRADLRLLRDEGQRLLDARLQDADRRGPRGGKPTQRRGRAVG